MADKDEDRRRVRFKGRSVIGAVGVGSCALIGERSLEETRESAIISR